MKKLIALLAVIACMTVAFTFVGCSKKVDEVEETPIVEQTPENEEQEEVEVPETEEEAPEVEDAE